MTPNNTLLYYLLPEGLREWCEEQRIQGQLYERYDGGGTTGFTIVFSNSEDRNRVADQFPNWTNSYFPSDGVNSLGSL